MGGLFSKQPKPSTINGIQFPQSKQGFPVPTLLGTGKLSQCIIWADGFSGVPQSGGKGGGKGGSASLYAADIIAALCNGPVNGITGIWSGQTWLASVPSSEIITVVSQYSPQFANALLNDNGVMFSLTYSATYTDLGAPASTIVNDTTGCPLQLIPWYNSALSYTVGSQVYNGTDVYTCKVANTGQALTNATYWTSNGVLSSGQYSVNPTSIGTFTVTSCANAGGGSVTYQGITYANTTVYNGTFTGGTSPYSSGASNAYVGLQFIVPGFTNADNNGTFVCVASSATQLTLANINGVAETHTTTAADTGNVYHFSAADAGSTAIVNYQFDVRNILTTVTTRVPSVSPGTVAIGGTFKPISGPSSAPGQGYPTVQYYNNDWTAGSPGPGGQVDGQMLTYVSGTPTVQGTYSFSQPNPAEPWGGGVLKFAYGTADANAEILVTFQYQNLGAVGNSTPNQLYFTLFGGNLWQPVWPYMLTGGPATMGSTTAPSFDGVNMTEPAFPGAALGYSGLAYLGFEPMSLGDSGMIQDNQFELSTPDIYGGGIRDCVPTQCLWRVLTDPVWGLGKGPEPFPVAAVDNGSTGTWGGANESPGTRLTGATAWNWCVANNYFISPKMDSQDSANTVMGRWLEAGQIAGFISEGKFKLAPYGTQTCAANGVTWVAPSTFAASLDDTSWVRKNEDEDPLKITRTSCFDGHNRIQIQWKNRLNQYADEITSDFNQASINQWGERLEEPQGFDAICTLPAAQFAANIRLKRSVQVLNGYEGTLPFIFSFLEPMDIVNVTTSSQWAAGLNNTLGLVNFPLRIKKVVDDPVEGLKMTFEDSLFASGQPVIYNKGASQGTQVAVFNANPGNTTAVLFEATNRLSKQQGNEIWIGASGGPNWGSCQVWVSTDGSKYLEVGTIDTAARLGTVASTFSGGSDPDTVNTLVVNLVNDASIDAGTSADADQGNTLCFVDGEIIAYSAASCTGANQYSMGTYTRRGQMGTAIGSHSAGTLFMRLDNSIFKYQYDPAYAGKTIYFKFCSANTIGNQQQQPADVTAVSFTIPGQNPGSIDASSGLSIAVPPLVGAGPLGWTPAA